MNLTFSVADQPRSGGKSIGILNVSLNLLRHLARTPGVDRLTVLANRSLGDWLPAGPNLSVQMHDEACAGKARRLLWDQFGLWAATRRAGDDWLYLPKGFTPLLGRAPGKLAVSVNDIMAVHYRERHPGHFPRGELSYFEHSLRATLRKADVIFTISQFTADELTRYARQQGERLPPVVVAGVGFGEEDILRHAAARAPADRQGLLVSVRALPHKRAAMAVAFVERWRRERGFGEPIHAVGSLPAAVDIPQEGGWRHKPHLTHEAYAELLGSVRALVYTSEYEGFGMPPVEAVLAGSWPVYSDIEVHREVMGESDTAFRNDDYDSFAAALDRAVARTPEALAPWEADLLARHHGPTIATRILATLRER